MKLGVIRRILKEDLQKAGAVPAWIDSLLVPLNQFIDSVVSTLSNLSFVDNFAGRNVTLSFKYDTPITISTQLKSKCVGVLPLYLSDSVMYRGHSWQLLQNNQIIVRWKWEILNTTGSVTSGSNQLTSLADVTGLNTGQVITGNGIPAGTTVSSVSGSTVTMSANALASYTGVRVAFSPAQISITFQLLAQTG